MGKGVQEYKHIARLQEWSTRIAACRSSGKGVKAWCAEQGIALKTYYNWERQIVKEATQQMALPSTEQSGMLMRIEPKSLRSGESDIVASVITIHHGESIITLPVGSSTEAVAGLVKALNRNA